MTAIFRGPTIYKREPLPPRFYIDSQPGVTSNRLLNLLASKDKFFAGAGQPPGQHDWPVPQQVRRPVSLLTFSEGVKVNLLSQGAVPFSLTDWPVPRGRVPAIAILARIDTRNPNTLPIDQFFGVAGNPLRDWSHCQPRPRPYNILLRTWINPLSQELLHQDQFFGAAGEPPPTSDFPVPKGRTPAISLRTHTEGLKLNLASQDTFYAAPGQPPEQRDFPVPKGRLAALALRTHVQQTPLNLAGKDTFFGLAGQPPENHDFPVPRGRAYPVVLRTWTESLKLNLLGQDAFGPTGAATVTIGAGFTTSPASWLTGASNSSIQTGNVDWWAGFWFKTTSDGILIGKSNENWSLGEWWVYALGVGSGLFARIFDGVGNTVATINNSTVNCADGNWHFGMMYYDSVGSSAGLSIDGGAFTTNALSGTPGASTTDFAIGAYNNGANALNGSMDAVAFGKSPVGGIAALTTTIRNALYNGGSGVDLATIDTPTKVTWGAVSAWRLNEASGQRSDLWGSNTLTDHNGVTAVTGKVPESVAVSLMPFALRPGMRELPNPRGRTPAISLRTHTQELKQNLIGQDAFGPMGATTVSLAAAFSNPGNTYLSVASNSSNQVTGDFWIAAWVYLTSKVAGADHWIALNSNVNNQGQFLFDRDRFTDTYEFQIQNGGTFRGVNATNFGTPPLSTWTFVLAWYDATANTISIRVNGGTANSSSLFGLTPGTAWTTFAVGAIDAASGAQAFAGNIDNLIFGKPSGPIASVISAISSRLYNSGSGLSFGSITGQERSDWGIVSGYTMNEASGTRADTFGSNNLGDNNGVGQTAGIVVDTLAAGALFNLNLRPGMRDWPNPRGRQRATSLLALQVGYNPSLYPPIAFPSVVVMAQGWYAPQIVMGWQLPTAQGAYNQEIVSGFFPDDGT